MNWEGLYVVRIESTRGASETLGLEPWPPDWQLPWQKQRVIVREVSVAQGERVLYRAELSEHKLARTAPPLKDPDGLEPDLPPSGPPCEAPFPEIVTLEVPDGEQDLAIRVESVVLNPPLRAGAYQQVAPAGVTHRFAHCSN
jgi:hypothetical protein